MLDTTEGNNVRGNAKKIMFVMRKAPHGTIYSYEGLESALIMAAHEQEITMVFIGDGLFALIKDQNTDKLGIKGFIQTYGALKDYDVEKIYVDKESMETRGIKREDFVIPVEVKEAEEIARVMEDQHALIAY